MAGCSMRLDPEQTLNGQRCSPLHLSYQCPHFIRHRPCDSLRDLQAQGCSPLRHKTHHHRLATGVCWEKVLTALTWGKEDYLSVLYAMATGVKDHACTG